MGNVTKMMEVKSLKQRVRGKPLKKSVKNKSIS